MSKTYHAIQSAHVFKFDTSNNFSTCFFGYDIGYVLGDIKCCDRLSVIYTREGKILLYRESCTKVIEKESLEGSVG